MSGLDPNSNLSFLVDATLLQVATGENEVILRFDNDTSITIESELQIQEENTVLCKSSDPKALTPHLLQLIGMTIQTTHILENSDLSLGFLNDLRVTIFAGNCNAESFVIKSDDTVIVV